MDFGLNPVFEYCSGLNSARFAESDSFQYLCTALVLNQLYLWVFMILDSFKYLSTVLVLIQLDLLNLTHSSIRILPLVLNQLYL